MRFKRKTGGQSVWTRELIPEDSVLRRELIPEDSIWRKELIAEDSFLRKDILAFTKRKSPCMQCPVLMVAEQHVCNRYDRIPDDIWDGIEICPTYERKIC